MKLRNLIHDLIKAGWTEARIATAMRERYGTTTTQPTINRMKSGLYEDPHFSTGWALVRLHQSEFPEEWLPKAS